MEIKQNSDKKILRYLVYDACLRGCSYSIYKLKKYKKFYLYSLFMKYNHNKKITQNKYSIGFLSIENATIIPNL
jgi:hypothetical protein